MYGRDELGVIVVAALALMVGPSREARAQGCVVARPDAPVLERSASGYAEAGQWQLSLGYRWYRSDRHYIGTEAQTQREADGSQDINDVSSFGAEIAYAITKRFSLAALVPYQIAQRSEAISDGTRVVARNRSRARGLGDVTMSGRAWLLDPETSLAGNILLSAGIKVPTGDDNAMDSFRSLSGPLATRTVDTSIQPGDGGIGFPIGVQAFYGFSFASLYFSGTYLLNPRETNGVNTYRPRASEQLASVPDSYVVRTGAFFPIYKGLAVGIGARLEGAPVRDVIGGDGGFRRPGYVLSAEPGLSFARGAWGLSATLPVALLRARLRSVPERDDNVLGDAAFFDFAVGLGASYRTGDKPAPQHSSSRMAHVLPSGPGRRLGALDARLYDVDVTPATLDGLLGKQLTVVNLWATWCGPCREEIPLLNELSRTYAARGVAFVGISVDDDPQLASAFAREIPFAYPAFWGGEAAARSINALTVPITVLLDKDGKIVGRLSGPLTRESLAAKIDELAP